MYYEILRREGKSENSLLYNSILLSAFSISGADALRFTFGFEKKDFSVSLKQDFWSYLFLNLRL